jgi:hypothetical protein
VLIMENNPENVKDKYYYLELLKQEILAITNSGKNNDAVYLHNDYVVGMNGIIFSEAKYYNPAYDPETQQFTISRLIPSPKSGEFNSMQDYVTQENSDNIYCFTAIWQGHLDGCLPVEERIFSNTQEVEQISRYIADGLRLSEQEATKVLRKHRKRLKSDYGIDNGDIPPGRMKRLIDKIIHDIDE